MTLYLTLAVVDGAEFGYWTAVASSVINGGAGAVAGQITKEIIMHEVENFIKGWLMNNVAEKMVGFVIDEEYVSWAMDNLSEIKALGRVGDELAQILSAFLFNVPDSPSTFSFQRYENSFDSVRLLLKTFHQFNVYFNFYEIQNKTDIGWSNLHNLNLDINYNYHNGFGGHLIANEL